MNFFRKILFVVAIFAGASSIFAQKAASERPALDAFRTELIAAVSENDLEGILAKLHPDVIVTWQDGEVCKGREEVRKFYEKMGSGKKKTFQGYIKPPTPDENTILYSDNTAGVVYGYNVGRFFLLGKEMELKNRWTATLVKQDGKWMLASYHVSMNILDNPLLNGAKKIATFGIPVAVIVGFFIGLLIGRRRKKPISNLSGDRP